MARKIEDVPDEFDGGEKHGLWSQYDPHALYEAGKLNKLHANHFTKHVVGEGMGVAIPQGVPHCVHSLPRTVAINFTLQATL